MADTNCPKCGKLLIVVPCTGTLQDYSGYGTKDAQCDNCGTYAPSDRSGQTCGQSVCSNCQAPINSQ